MELIYSGKDIDEAGTRPKGEPYILQWDQNTSHRLALYKHHSNLKPQKMATKFSYTLVLPTNRFSISRAVVKKYSYQPLRHSLKRIWECSPF